MGDHTMKNILRILVCILFAIVLTCKLEAAEYKITIPDQKWTISFESPTLSGSKESNNANSYVYQANSDRFNISIFVEPPKGPGMRHKDCFNYYWPRGAKNPLIDQKSIKITESKRYVKVEYNIIANIEGKTVSQQNINFFFANKGKWVDVHVSIIMPTALDITTFSTFEKSLRYNN